jgi:hypothetical protein
MHINIFNFSFLFVPYILRLFFKGHGEKLFMKGYHQWFMKGYEQWFCNAMNNGLCNAMNNGFATP